MNSTQAVVVAVTSILQTFLLLLILIRMGRKP